MQLVTLCPLSLGAVAWQPRPGEHALTLVCKATFELREGMARLAAEQDPLHDLDRHYSDDPVLSVHAPADLVPLKQRVDVLLVGDAFAPDGPARLVRARLAVASIDKTIEVFGDRHLDAQGELHESGRFTRMPLGWERAAGGAHTVNPIGVDRAASADRYGRRRVPNLQPPGVHVTGLSDIVAPIGFGPIAASWPARRELLSAGAAEWFTSGRWSERPLPGDFDPLFWQAAPLDQRLEELREGERILLENLRPGAPQVVCQLPLLRPRAFAERPSAVREVAMRADTLWIDTTRGALTVVWRGQLEVAAPGEAGRVLMAAETAEEPLTWAQIQRMAGSRSSGARTRAKLPRDLGAVASTLTDPGEGTLAGREGTGPALPFVAGEAAPPSISPATVHNPRKGTTPFPHKLSAEDRSPAWLAKGREEGEDMRTFADGSMSPWAAQKRNPAVTTLGVAPPAAVASPPVGAGAMSAIPAQAAIVPPMASPMASSIASPIASPAATLLGASVALQKPPPVRPPNPLEAPPPVERPTDRPPRNDKSEPEAARAPEAPPAETVQLVWFDEASVAAIVADPAWQPILDAQRAPPPKPSFDFDAEPPEPPGASPRKQVSAIVARAVAFAGAEMAPLLAGAIQPDGSFEPPLVLVRGTLRFPFDEVAALKAMLTAVSPFVAANKALAEAVDTANQLLQAPWLSGEMATNVAKKVRAAFEKERLDAAQLDENTERILLAERSYQRRELLGKRWIRALMTTPSAKTPVVAYLPDALAKELPMFTAIAARVIAELHPPQDQYEPCDVALKVIALARILSFAKPAADPSAAR